MQPQKVIIGHSWIDVSVNIQTKAVAFALSKEAKVWYLTQSRINEPLPTQSNLVVQEWPNKRPTKRKDFVFAIRQVQKIKPDLIIVHFASTKALLFAGWLSGVKYRIAWYHTLAEQAKLEAGSKFKAVLDLMVRTITYRLATHVITFTPYASLDATQKQHIHPKKIHIIPNGVQSTVKRRLSYDYNADAITFLYVGRITYTKGCDVLVNIFDRLCKTHNNIYLHFVGGGDEEVQMQSLITAKGLASKVILKGLTTLYAAVFEQMTEAYALLVPSRVDNYPTVIIEAMACGLPVIGANAGGIPYMIEHGVNGFVCNNEKEWIEKCELLINSPALRNKMAEHARNTFESRYTIERHVEKVLKFIHSLP